MGSEAIVEWRLSRATRCLQRSCGVVARVDEPERFNLVLGHPAVADVAVIGVPDELLGEAIEAGRPIERFRSSILPPWASSSDRTMDSHLRNLRAKLNAAGCTDAVDTMHGIGIRMGPCRGEAA